MSDTASQTPRIAIVGGGPSGLVLLLTLLKRGVPATLYEREPDAFSRAHLGGTLDLGWGSGQRALRENGLEDAFKAHSRPEGDSYRVMDASGTILMETSGDDHKDPHDLRPEIDRTMLRRILLDAIPPEHVKWDHALASARALGDGRHELAFANGATATCDVLVGADGAHSRVRPLVSPAVAEYTGVAGAEISLAPAVAARDELADVRALVGNGSAFAVQGGRVLGAQRNGDGRIRTYAWLRTPERWMDALPADGAAARATLLAEFAGWAPVLLKLVEHCDVGAVYPRALYQLPLGHRWDHAAGVTLVGDAAHLMTPFAGAGANVAMLDGLELGVALAESIKAGQAAAEREAVVAAWEEKMFVAAHKWMAISAKNLADFTAPDAPYAALEEAKKTWSQPGARREDA